MAEYDNLLDEALADFDEPVVIKQAPATHPEQASPAAPTTATEAKPEGKAAPKGLGGLSLGKKGGPKKSQAPKSSETATKTTNSSAPDLSNLPPDVRQLAEDLFKLVEDADISKASAGKTQAELEAEALAQLSSLGLNLDLPQASGSFKSPALQGLFDQTQKAVTEHQTRGQKDDSKKSGAASGAAANPLEALLGDMSGILGGGGLPFGASDTPGGSMNLMIEHVMRNLLSKEVLYGPLKDIRDKYPPWLAARRESLLPADLTRFEAQYLSVQAVCRQYEEAPEDFGKLVDLIQEMQTHGDPPKEIVEDMTGGGGGMPGDLAGLLAGM